MLQKENEAKDIMDPVLRDAIDYLNTLGPEESERRLRALCYFAMLITHRSPAEAKQELLELIIESAQEEEVEIMARTMVDIWQEEVRLSKTQGIEEGKAQGIEEGLTQARQQDLVKLLRHHFPKVSDTYIEEVQEIRELARLDKLFDQILIAKSIKDIDFNSNGSQ